MAKDKIETIEEPVVEPVVAPKAPSLITLDEFCMMLSKEIKKVALIGGFHFHMKNVEKVRKETAAFFRERFEAFKKMPA
jgi:hypothetical protein